MTITLFKKLTVGILALLIPIVACAQGSKEDYERADDLRKRLSGKVFRDRVEPNWIGPSTFWYSLRTGKDSRRYIVVDAERGTREEAFDHGRLAAALGKGAADRLPIRNLAFTDEGKVIEFESGGVGYRYSLDSNELEKVERKASSNGTTVNVLKAPRVARFNGESTEISFENKTEETIEIFWIGNLESPTSYGKIDAGERFDQHTYAGHVWLVLDSNEKPLGVFEATESPGLAVIDGSWKPGAVEEKPRRRRERERVRGPRGSASPDGLWRVDLIENNVSLTDVQSNETWMLTDSGTKEDPFLDQIHWSPDSSRVVVIQKKMADKRVVHVVESSPKDQQQPLLKSFDYVKPGDVLDHPRPRLFDVVARKRIPISEELFPNPWQLSEFRWDPDSSQFTFLYNQRGHQVLRLVGVNGKSGAASALIEETPETFVCYSQKSFYRRFEETNEILWMSERDGWNHLYLFDSKSGKLKNQITKGAWVVRKVDRVDQDKRQIWFQSGGIHSNQDPYHIHYARVNFDGSGLVILTEGDGTHEVGYSPDGRFHIDTYSRVDLPPVSELRRTSDGSLILTLEVADTTQLREAGGQKTERFVAKGRDEKTDIYGIIHKPTNFDPSKKYPVIEKIYAGPHSAHVPKRFSSGGSAMAELGFIVVQIDGMGTSHRSKAFHDVCWQDIGDAGFPDRVRWIKAAAEARPWMDVSRVGIFGGSAGGQNSMRALIAHHDFYHVAVADCGCHDNRMDKIWWNEQWMGYPLGDHYAASSNVDQAHRLQGKLMLIVGELDQNVDPASTMQVADALIKADKDFDLVVIPGAGHGAAGTRYGRRRQRDFFVRHLLGVEPRHVKSP